MAQEMPQKDIPPQDASDSGLESYVSDSAGGDDTPAKPTNQALNAVVTRNIFYRDGFRIITRISILLAAALLVLMIALVVTIQSSRPVDRFFATTSDGRLIRLLPLGQPNLNDAAVVSWSAQAATEIMTFGFHDFEKRLQDASTYFTRRGWQSFSQALSAAGLIENVRRNNQVLTATAQKAPIIVEQGVDNGVYRWIIDMPLIVTYQAGRSAQNEVMNVRLVIIRVSTLDSEHGIGIQQWIAR